MRENSPVRFGKRPTEKDPNHGHLAGGLFHSEEAVGTAMRPPLSDDYGYERWLPSTSWLWPSDQIH